MFLYNIGSGLARSSDGVFLYQGDISLEKEEVSNLTRENSSQANSVSRGKRAVIRTNGVRLWKRNPSYAIDSSLRKLNAFIEKLLHLLIRNLHH